MEDSLPATVDSKGLTPCPLCRKWFGRTCKVRRPVGALAGKHTTDILARVSQGCERSHSDMGQLAEELLVSGCLCIGPNNMSPCVDVFLTGLKLYTALPRTDDRCLHLGASPGHGDVRHWASDRGGEWAASIEPRLCDRDSRVFLFENISATCGHSVHDTSGMTASGISKFGTCHDLSLIPI